MDISDPQPIAGNHAARDYNVRRLAQLLAVALAAQVRREAREAKRYRGWRVITSEHGDQEKRAS